MLSANYRQAIARYLVARYLDEDQVRFEGRRPTINDLYVAEFSTTFNNWKALVLSNIPNNRVYEVTYAAFRDEAYLRVFEGPNAFATFSNITQYDPEVLRLHPDMSMHLGIKEPPPNEEQTDGR